MDCPDCPSGPIASFSRCPCLSLGTGTDTAADDELCHARNIYLYTLPLRPAESACLRYRHPKSHTGEPSHDRMGDRGDTWASTRYFPSITLSSSQLPIAPV